MSELNQELVLGCGTCMVASFGNCKGHLRRAAKIVAEGFFDAGWEFTPSDPQHFEITESILAEDIIEDGQHVSYKMPEDPNIQEDFFETIRGNIKDIKAASTVAQSFIEAKTLFDRNKPEHIEAIKVILAKDIRDEAGKAAAYEIPKDPDTRKWFLDLITQKVEAGLGLG